MKSSRNRILMTGLFLAAFLGITWSETSENISIPSQISAFYEDYNFISSFSTKAERKRLMGCMGEAKIPKDLKCQRLENVLRRMKKLRQRVSVNDSEMVIWRGTVGSFFGFHFRPVLFVVGDVQLFEERALVEVRSYELEKDMILRFIAKYDNFARDKDRSYSLEERIKKIHMAAPGLEIHRWCCQNGKWMKSASDLFFLDQKN